MEPSQKSFELIDFLYSIVFYILFNHYRSHYEHFKTKMY